MWEPKREIDILFSGQETGRACHELLSDAIIFSIGPRNGRQTVAIAGGGHRGWYQCSLSIVWVRSARPAAVGATHPPKTFSGKSSGGAPHPRRVEARVRSVLGILIRIEFTNPLLIPTASST